MSNVFTKSFISFSKELAIAENFLNIGKKNAILKIIKAEKNYDLFTHADIENLSVFFKEKEVLFFPFSTFGIDKFDYNQQKKRYEIELIYLGKFIKDFQNQKTSDKLPDTNFKIQFKESGLAKKEIDNIPIEKITKEYINYTEVKKSKCNKKCFLWLLLLLGLLGLIKKDSGDSDGDKTLKCKEGTYSGGLYSSKCYPCSIGYYSEAGAIYCKRCPYGQSSYGNSSTCFNCSAGTFSDYYNKECAICEGGTYSVEGSSSCIKCPGGKYSKDGAENA